MRGASVEDLASLVEATMRGMQNASRASAAATAAAAIRVAAEVLQGTPAPTSAEAETKERVAAIVPVIRQHVLAGSRGARANIPGVVRRQRNQASHTAFGAGPGVWRATKGMEGKKSDKDGSDGSCSAAEPLPTERVDALELRVTALESMVLQGESRDSSCASPADGDGEVPADAAGEASELPDVGDGPLARRLRQDSSWIQGALEEVAPCVAAAGLNAAGECLPECEAGVAFASAAELKGKAGLRALKVTWSDPSTVAPDDDEAEAQSTLVNGGLESEGDGGTGDTGDDDDDDDDYDAVSIASTVPCHPPEQPERLLTERAIKDILIRVGTTRIGLAEDATQALRDS